MRVLLVHGLGRTPASLAVLAMRLRAHGHEMAMFGYLPLAQSFDSIVDRLRTRMQMQADRGPYAVVTHSLGGVLARAALQDVGRPPEHLVMIAPPNQPPRLARWAVRLKPFTWYTRDSGARLADGDFYDRLPPPSVPYTIIAGTRGVRVGPLGDEPNDGIVAVSETRVTPHDAVETVPGTHTFLMNRRDVAELVARALETQENTS